MECAIGMADETIASPDFNLVGGALLFKVCYCKNLISIYLISLISHIVDLRGILVELDELSMFTREIF